MYVMNKTKAKLNHIEFENKKLVLLCEKLEENLNDTQIELQKKSQ